MKSLHNKIFSITSASFVCSNGFSFPVVMEKLFPNKLNLHQEREAISALFEITVLSLMFLKQTENLHSNWKLSMRLLNKSCKQCDGWNLMEFSSSDDFEAADKSQTVVQIEFSLDLIVSCPQCYFFAGLVISILSIKRFKEMLEITSSPTRLHFNSLALRLRLSPLILIWWKTSNENLFSTVLSRVNIGIAF